MITAVPWLDDEEPDEEELRALECQTCGGEGNCPRCKGEGVRWDREQSPVNCALCGGDGECYDCGGSGNR